MSFDFVGNKQNKQWLIYAYHRESGEIVAYVWGKRDLATVQRLKARLKSLGFNMLELRVIIGIVLSQHFNVASK